MPAEYAVAERLNDGLVVIRRTEDGQTDYKLWSRCKLRKEKPCAVTGQVMPKGTLVYSPTGNTLYRYERIDAAVVDDAKDDHDG